MVMFSPAAAFSPGGREEDSVVAELEGALLISRNTFAYFMLVAFEAGGPLRALLLLLASPLVTLLEAAGSHSAAIRVMVFIATAGLPVADVKAVAKATLPRFFLQDLSEKALAVFTACGGKKYVVTSMPRVMVEPFLSEYLDVACVVGTELRTAEKRCSGAVAPPGVMIGRRRLEALKVELGGYGDIDVGLDGGLKEHSFLLLCREAYIVPPAEKARPLPRRSYPKPLVFHDGRFVLCPDLLNSLVVLLWMPVGIALAIGRILVGVVLPFRMQVMAGAALGVCIRSKFAPTSTKPGSAESKGTLYACCHRTLLDPVITATTLQRSVTAVTYSLSTVSEILSPIPTVRLTRDRLRDGETMKKLLEKGELVVCPEGTTCREPYLLRFSPLFAEIAKDIVPLAIKAEGGMFYGTTVRGYKWLDSFFFLMNPLPSYRLEFLDRIPGDSRSGYDVANRVQQAIAGALGFQCTNFTRRDKYRMIAGNDGLVERKS
ncbi:hypothetical protein Taro_039074 [Colocasia esculenta]|uniref:Phospholipid/glycerol acyltransferase domain-containing protein n=1 Tax=Colocasia esculenta TaxID=4460 RepID=A0A843WQH8_COLES|nr:hypothetical protein [Colocasia esculenta]